MAVELDKDTEVTPEINQVSFESTVLKIKCEVV